MISTSALWNWGSPVWLVAAALLVLYALACRGATPRQFAVLAIGMLLLVLAYVSPIGVLADGYLFSAHMVQHLLLLLLVPLLMLLALPKQRVAAWFEHPRLDRMGRWRALAAIGWTCGVGAMWFWHVPTLCSASTRDPLLGGLRDLSFVLAGLAFWWPIYSPLERFRLEPLAGIAYLFSACLGCTLLGIYITFTTVSVCPAFVSPVDRLGILHMLDDVGLTPSQDQNLGGLLMWVPPCSLYVSACISLLRRWYSANAEPSSTGEVSTMAESV